MKLKRLARSANTYILLALVTAIIAVVVLGLPRPVASPSIPTGSQTIDGQLACLPKLGTGPQTMECAIGLRANDGRHYALRQASAESSAKLWGFPMGTNVRVTGTVTAPSTNEVYDIVGIIDTTNIAKP